jgi:hypothetical protein
MSAKNRGSIRNESDFYITPESSIETFLENFKISANVTGWQNNILEPTAGNGAIVKVLRKYYPSNKSMIDAVELRKEEKINLNKEASTVFIQDFLTFEPIDRYDCIITNPPYSIAREIIEHCFKIADKNTDIIMLLRLGFLEAKKRRDFWKKHPLTQLYPLINRPSFTGKGTDATAYGWFVWSNTRPILIKSI